MPDSADSAHKCDCRPGIDGSGWYHESDCATNRKPAPDPPAEHPPRKDDPSGHLPADYQPAETFDEMFGDLPPAEHREGDERQTLRELQEEIIARRDQAGYTRADRDRMAAQVNAIDAQLAFAERLEAREEEWHAQTVERVKRLLDARDEAASLAAQATTERDELRRWRERCELDPPIDPKQHYPETAFRIGYFLAIRDLHEHGSDLLRPVADLQAAEARAETAERKQAELREALELAVRWFENFKAKPDHEGIDVSGVETVLTRARAALTDPDSEQPNA